MAVLSVYSRKELSLPLSLSMGLLCACTVTDALRTWLPAELTLPLAVTMIWHASLSPWGFQRALIWGAVWAGFYGGRWLFYRLQRREDPPGSGDIILAGNRRHRRRPSSAFLIASAIAGHLPGEPCVICTRPPFGPWLCLAITVQLIFF
ncbi:peptidase [Escherichia coli]|uniref:peptidase n=1 Tax=Escherichia coli TaxID=562 RepID=UPI001FCC9614|nr:peptidase [Escherichia coli]